MANRVLGWTPLLAVVLTAAAGAVLGWSVRAASNREALAERLHGDSAQIAEDLSRRIGVYELGLRGARGAVIGANAGITGISRERFRMYARSREFEREFPGARGFGYVRRVPRGAAPALVAAMRRQGVSGFRIRELAAHDGEQFVILYLEPEAPNAAAIGLDIASEPARREAALASMRSGRPTLSGPITLVQASGKRNRSVLFLLPVYEGDAPPDNPAQWQRRTVGWIYAPLVIEEMIAADANLNAYHALRVVDVTREDAPLPFYGGAQAPDGPSHTMSLDAYGRRWQIEVFATPALEQAMRLTPPWRSALWTALLGALIAALLVAYEGYRAGRARLREHRLRLASLVEESADPIIGVTPSGEVVEWNPAATRMFGHSQADAVGHSLVELIVPFERAGEDARLLARAAAGERITGHETLRRHRDGSPVHVEINASALRGRERGDRFIALTLRDIGERKDAEARVRQQAAALEDEVAQRNEALASYGALQRAILHSASYAIIATDPDGLITLFNPAAEAMLGYRSEELVGRDTPALFHDRGEVMVRANALTLELERAIEPGFEAFVAGIRDGGSDTREWTYIARDGTRIPVLLTVSPMQAEDGSAIGFLGIAVDLRERKRREAALAVSEHKLRSLFELSPIGIVLSDEDGRFVEFNEAFRELTGYPAEELREIEYWKLTPEEYHQRELQLVEQVKHTGRYGPFEKQYLRKDGSRIAIRLNGVGLQLAGRSYIWSLVEDITLQHEAEQAMRSAVVAAEETSRAKSDFLANMSHEIRTPMNAILGMLQLLRRTGLDARQVDYSDKAETAARTLLALINDILDFSKIEAGHQALDPHPFDVQPMLHELSVLLSAGVGDKDIEVVFDIDPALPPRLVGDALRLKQVLINLTGNAVKFTELGEVVLSVRVREAAADALTLHFEVRDTGIGIAAEQVERIFEGFSQAEASTTRRFGGTGLGLAISRRLVRMMGGELHVDSERGRGSRFHFELRLGHVAAEPAAPAPRPYEGLRVLVVDDNRSARETVAEMGATLGWRIEQADSGEAALAALQDAHAAGRGFDVVFLDWRMPGLDGLETGRRIRAQHIGDGAPLVVMVTAHGRELMEKRARDEGQGLDGYLAKPVTLSMLVDAVTAARGAFPVGTPARPASASTAGRLDGLRVLVVEDNLVNQQVVRELLLGEGAQVRVVDGGGAALRALAGGAHQFDAVLMDIQMPGMDGYTATREIRGRLGIGALPIIAMTANVQSADREAALAAGMNDHIGKPFELDALVERLLHWTGRAAAAREVRVSPSSASPASSGISAVDPAPVDPAPADPGPTRVTPTAVATATAAPPVFDPHGALQRFGGNVAVYAGALERFDDDLAARLDGYGRALAAGDGDTAARELHTLKGIAATVGAMRLAATAAGIEAESERAPAANDAFDAAPGGSARLAALAQLKRLRADAAALRERLGEWRAAQGHAAPGGAPASTAPERAQLEALAALLAASSLKSLAAWTALEPALSRRAPATAAAIAGAVARLDFAAAHAALVPLLVEPDVTAP